jgi:hypothetical protein
MPATQTGVELSEPGRPASFDAHAYAPGETAESIAAESERLAREIEAHPAPKA